MDTENSKPKDNWKRVTCILFALLLICNAAIFVLSLGMKTQLNEHNKILLTIPPDLQEQILGSFQQTATDLKTKILNTATTTSETIIAQADKKNNSVAFEQMVKSVEKQMSALGNDTSTQLAAIKTKVDSIGTSASATAQTLANLNLQSKRAEKSFEMAKKSVENGDVVKAKRYMLNAISNCPERVNYLNYFAEITLKGSNVTIDELDMVVNLIDNLLYKIPAEDIEDAMNLREQVDARRVKLVSNIAPVQVDVNAEINDLEKGKYALKNIIKNNVPDMETLKFRIEKITNMLAEEQLTDKNREKLTAYLNESSIIYSSQSILDSVDSALTKASTICAKKSLTNYEILTARNQVSTANTMLTQIWIANVPGFIFEQAKIRQQKIADIDERLNQHASREAKTKHDEIAGKINAIKNHIKNNSVSYYATKTGQLTKFLTDAQTYMNNLSTLRVYDEKGQKAVRETIDDLRNFMQKIIDIRYKAYQKWAIDKIEAARKSREDISALKAYSNSKAIEDFKTYLMDIDRGLLTYDVGTCYDKVHQLIFVEQIPDSKKAEIQYQKATFDRIGKLEDF